MFCARLLRTDTAATGEDAALATRSNARGPNRKPGWKTQIHGPAERGTSRLYGDDGEHHGAAMAACKLSGIIPLACISPTSGMVILPSIRTGTFSETSGSCSTLMASKSPGPMTYRVGWRVRGGNTLLGLHPFGLLRGTRTALLALCTTLCNS